MGNGKRADAPCGHPGEHIIGTYVKCLQGCDTKDEVDWSSVTLKIPRCMKCNSLNVEDFELDTLYYVFNPGSTIVVDTRCVDCGYCWIS